MSLELRFTIPGQVERQVPVDQPPMKIGALLSNQVVLRAPGVDPIHALIEEPNPGEYVVTDLGSVSGIKVNDQHVEVESPIKAGDVLTVGTIQIHVVGPAAAAAVPKVEGGEAARFGATVKAPENQERRDDSGANQSPQTGEARAEAPERQLDLLFSPRKAKPSGDVLEVVAYWGDTVLDVELFHPSTKGYDRVTIGDPTKSHLIAAGSSDIDVHPLARFSSGGYKISLIDGMTARLRKGGKVDKVTKPGEISLGSRDIAHIKYGAVSYFLMFVKPPPLEFPKSGFRDPFFFGLMSVAMLFYMILIPIAWTHVPAPKKEDKEDIWHVVSVPEKEPEKEKEKPKPPEKPKPEVKIAEVKTPPKKPPPPKPKPEVKPAKPTETEKPVQTKPVEKPVEQKKPTEVLTENKPTPEPKPAEAKPAGPPSTKPNLNKLSAGMPSTGAKDPNFKAAGPTLPNTAIGKSGGAVGSGMNQAGGAIKGNNKASVMGVEGANNDKPSGVNLSKLGLGVGKIMSKTGAGAISSNFKDSAGGAGGGMGSAGKTYGLGGIGSGKSLGLAGAGGAVNNFGSGSGGLLSGQGGTGGRGGSGLGPGFGNGGGAGGAGGAGGHGRANVTVPAGDPVVSGGLTSQEIMAVIRANLNQIRHCYEQLLQRSPSASGKMGTTFVIDTGGRVSSVSVSQDTINDAVMRGCVTDKMRRWAFPKPRGGQSVTVNYPFVFNPL